MGRKSFIAGNWKMHKTVSEAVTLAREIVESTPDCKNTLMIAPPFTALMAVREIIGGSHVMLGAQNMAAAEEGAHTGEISPRMLRDIGVEYVIIGHSERRHVYGESDELINQKVRLAVSQSFQVILCVGETLDERERGEAERTVTVQLEKGVEGLKENELDLLTIAYEPVWAIGTGKNATPEDADAMHIHIRNNIRDKYSSACADGMVIQYGGSVKPDNVIGLMTKENIDGALVGGASLTADTFVPIALYNR